MGYDLPMLCMFMDAKSLAQEHALEYIVKKEERAPVGDSREREQCNIKGQSKYILHLFYFK